MMQLFYENSSRILAGNYFCKIDSSKMSEKVLNALLNPYPVGIYLFKVNNGNTRAICEIRSKLKI